MAVAKVQVSNDNPDNCTQDGYTTEMSWGYRVRGKLEYPNAFAGINLEPFFAWSHDVDGYGPEPGSQFIEDRYGIECWCKCALLKCI